MRTIEQERAADALKRASELRGQTLEFKERYRSYVDRLGPAVVMTGLGQALATEVAAAGSKPNTEDKRAHLELYKGVERWLCRPEGGVYPSSDDLLHSITKNEEKFYVRAQIEALAWLEWHKKFCRAFLPEGDGDGK